MKSNEREYYDNKSDSPLSESLALSISVGEPKALDISLGKPVDESAVLAPSNNSKPNVFSEEQKVALVTGGISGIGKAIAVLLKSQGYQVIVSYHTNDQAARAFRNETGIPTLKFDISDYDACGENINSIIEEYGMIHCLINNAGITKDNMLHKMALNEWQIVMRTNLDGVFNACRHVIEHMRLAGFGRIVNVSSVNGLTGQFGQCNYAASKAGMIGFTKSLARESASKGITVNCVAPGYTETDMTAKVKQDIKDKIIEQIPAKRFAKPEEIADGVLYLLRSEYITGHTLSINGGLHMN